MDNPVLILFDLATLALMTMSTIKGAAMAEDEHIDYIGFISVEVKPQRSCLWGYGAAGFCFGLLGIVRPIAAPHVGMLVGAWLVGLLLGFVLWNAFGKPAYRDDLRDARTLRRGDLHRRNR